MDTKTLLLQGKMLPMMEEFYTLQGEGFHSGSAAHFIRIGGCDIACHWCDIKESWNEKLYPPTLTDDIVNKIIDNPAKTIVVTGGEPLIYNLDYLTSCLKKHGLSMHLETSGAYPITGTWDWICLSPKKRMPPQAGILKKADELKVIIFENADFEWAEKYRQQVNSYCKLYLQPEWSKKEKIIPLIISYIKKHPDWKISLQAHKYIGIP